MTAVLKGMYAALLTGFSDSEEFDETRQRNIVDYVLKQGLSGLYVGGSTGESGLMTTDELFEQQGVVMDAAKIQSPTMIAHIGQPSLRDAIKLAKNAEALGYDALSALPPHSYKFSPEEVFHYYKDLASATNLPLIVYEIPSRVGRESSLEELDKLLSLPGVAGIKFTSQNLYVFSQIRKKFPHHVMYHGFDETFMSGALFGADGGIGSTYNVFGKLYAAIDKSMEAKDMDRARALQALSVDYVSIILKIGVMPAVKHSLQLLGVDCGVCRKPFRIMSEPALGELEQFLSAPEVRQWTVSANFDLG